MSRSKNIRIELSTTLISVVYVETVLDVLTGALAKPALACLGDKFAFAAAFDAAMAHRSGPVEPPWPPRAGRGFWAYYFEEQRPLPETTGAQAWRAVVPFRTASPLSPSVADDRVRVSLDAFVYPHGLGLVATATLKGDLTPAEAAELAIALRTRPSYDLPGLPAPVALDTLAGQALDHLRASAFGAGVSPGRRPPTPFTVTTVVQGTGADRKSLPADGSDAHRFLDAVTTWSPTWRDADVGTVEAHRLASKTSGVPDSHIVYKHDRARAVWFPGSFLPEPPAKGAPPPAPRRTLSCFHRNLVAASLQVESFASFATATAAHLAVGSRLSDAHRDAAVRVGNVVGRLYGGARSTYRSRSPQAQIDDAGLAADLNTMRAAVGQPALFVPA